MTTDDPRAKADLQRTLGEVRKLAERKGMQLDTTSSGSIDAVQVAPGEAVLAHLIVGMRGSLTRTEARRTAVAFKKLAAKPNTTIAIAIAGYDLDDREVDRDPRGGRIHPQVGALCWRRHAGLGDREPAAR